MKATVTVDGVETEHEIDIDIEHLTMRQAVQLEKLLGSEKTFRLMNGDPRVAVMPSTIQALVFVALWINNEDLNIDDFDINLGELNPFLADDNSDDVVVELPMTLADGSVIDGGSPPVDPTQTAAG